jgi:protein-disulfide isomerase
MTEEMNGGCCGGGEKKVSKDALAVAGAILVGSLVIAATMFVISPKTASVALPAGDAKQPVGEEKPEVTLDQVKALFGKGSVAFGDVESKVVFTEFSDPSCPFCHVAAGKNPSLNKEINAQFVMAADGGSYVPPVPEMKKLIDAKKAGYVWVYNDGHGNGRLAAEALYCAHEKGKFWEAHDLLMSAAGYTLTNETVKNDRKKAGVMADFLKSAVKPADMKACLESGKYTKRLTEDMAVAKAFGSGGTPAFFVNTTLFSGAYSFTDMQATVDQFLK